MCHTVVFLVGMEHLRWHAYHIIVTANLPMSGKCDVKPTEGTFLQDPFAVNCSGFSSEYNPLTYMFYMDPGNDTISIHGETDVTLRDFTFSSHVFETS